MSEYEVKNAVIEGMKLGVDHTDHGILSFSIQLDYGGSGQSFGGIVLDTYDKKKDKRIPTNLASSLLLAIHEVYGCDWEKLKGKSIRAYSSFGNVLAIGHYLDDKWLWFNKKSLEFNVTTFCVMKSLIGENL